MHSRRTFLASSVAFASSTALAPLNLLAQDNDWAAKMFEKTSHDFGVVARGADTTYRLKLKNLYKEEVHIAEVRTTCGCSAGKPSVETLASLEEAWVEIKMDTVKFMRRKDSNVIVVFDRPTRAEVTIPITAYIRTDVVVEPGSAQFGPVQRDEKAEKVLKIAYAGREDWKIKEVQSGLEHVTARAVETSRSGGNVNYDLIVTLSDKAPVGAVRHFLTLMTDDPSNPNVPVLVEGEVKPDIEVSPAIVSLGTMAPGSTKTVNVVLKSRKPFEVSAVTCDRAQDVFQVRLPKTAAPVHVIPLTVTAPTTAGTLDEQLSITIPGRAEPVTVRAYARIVADS